MIDWKQIESDMDAVTDGEGHLYVEGAMVVVRAWVDRAIAAASIADKDREHLLREWVRFVLLRGKLDTDTEKPWAHDLVKRTWKALNEKEVTTS